MFLHSSSVHVMAFRSHRAASFLARDQLLVLVWGLAVVFVQAYQLGDASSSLAALSCFPADLVALQQFAASFNSSPFFRSHWRPQVECCSWEGVTCARSTNNESRVVGLALAAKSLVGSFSAALCRLSALSSLDLSNSYLWEPGSNSLSGPIPSCIGYNLTNLQHLSLRYSINFKSTIPESFSLLLSLKTLDLQFTGLFGSLSPIANLALLSFLDVSFNGLNGTMAILNTPSLQYLDVSYNQISGSIPSFNTTPNLQFLNLSSNEWRDVPSLPHLLHLEEFNLEEFSGSVPAEASSLSKLFCDLTSLRRLVISGSDAYSPQYRYSDLYSHHGAISGTLDQQLQCERPYVNLTHLDLSSNKLTGPFPAWISLFSNLQYLDLSANNFSGSIPQEWQMLTHLTSLQLSADSPVTPVFLPQHIPDWLFRQPLQTLRLRSMGLTIQDFQCDVGLSLLNQTLHILDLSDNHLSNGSSLWHCLAHHNFTFLSELYLSNNPLAFNLASSQPLSHHLDSLGLSSCQLVGSLTIELLSSVHFQLDLGQNHLAGSIPSKIGSLGPQFLWLDVSFNNLTGPIPPSLWNLSSIEGIILNNNYLDGEIRLDGRNLSEISLINVANNQFTKASFHNIANKGFTLMEILDLSFNKLEGDLQELFGDYSMFNSLMVLILSNNQLTGSIPASLGESAPHLKAIELSNNKLTGAIPESLKNLRALQASEQSLLTLVNDFNLQSVKGVKFIGNVLLGHLDLSSNMLTGSIPMVLGELIGLNDLNLSTNLLSGPIPPSLSNLSQLQSLDLSRNNLEGPIPKALSTISALEIFNVSFNPNLSGQIPDGPQLENADSYRGDPNLCGYQIQKDCTHVTNSDQQPTIDVDHRSRVDMFLDWIEDWSSIPGICLGYVVGVGVTIWVLKLMKFYG